MPNSRPSDPPGILTKTSPATVDDTVSRLLALLSERGLKVFAVIDHSGEAHAMGLALRPTKVVIFGSPAAGTPVMDAVPMSALDLPLKVLIWDDDGVTRVSYTAPDVLATRYGLGRELATRLAGIDPLTSALVSDGPT